MDVLSLDNPREIGLIAGYFKNYGGTYFQDKTLVGGMKIKEKHGENWYWVSSGNRIAFGPSELSFNPNETRIDSGNENCLSIARYPDNSFYYKGVNCNGPEEFRFICERKLYRDEL